MNLTDLKTKPIEELINIANEMGLDNMARSRKQDVIFCGFHPDRLIYGIGTKYVVENGLCHTI